MRAWLDTFDAPIGIGHGGDIVSTAAKLIPVKGRGAWMDPGPLGTLGVGAPFALAAQIAHPEKRVVIVYGDGSFGLNGFEFDTAVRHNLPIIGVIGNDGAWGQMMRPQGAMLGWDRLDASLLNRTHYEKVVEAFGGHGELVARPDELRPARDCAASERRLRLAGVSCTRCCFERVRASATYSATAPYASSSRTPVPTSNPTSTMCRPSVEIPPPRAAAR